MFCSHQYCGSAAGGTNCPQHLNISGSESYLQIDMLFCFDHSSEYLIPSLINWSGSKMPSTSTPASTSIFTAAGDRSDRSRGWPIESIDSIESIILKVFRFFWHVGELKICLVAKFQLCTTLGSRKNAEKLKNIGFVVKFDLIDSIISSIRSIIRL